MLKKIATIFLLLIICFVPIMTLAQDNGTNEGTVDPITSINDDAYALENPLGNDSSTIHTVIENILKALLGLVGVLALVMFIIGGFKVMTAQGDGKKAQAGFQTLLWATLGLIIIFASRILLNTILGAF